MDDKMFELLKQLGQSAIVVGALAWLAQKIIRHWLDKDITIFKENLKAEATRQLEDHKSQLRDEELVFSQIREKRVLIIGELYRLMLRATSAVEYHVKMQDHWPDEDTRQRKLDQVQKQVREFRDYFDQHQIWLDEETREKVQEFLEEHTEGLFYQFANAVALQRSNLGKNWVPQKILELWTRANDNLPAARQVLEAQFRKAVITSRRPELERSPESREASREGSAGTKVSNAPSNPC